MPGGNQTLKDTDMGGDESATLDGTLSFDPDGTLVSYEWFEGATLFGIGPTLTLPLSVGVHTINLVVTDDEGATDTDTAVITINVPPNQDPVADAGADQTVVDSDEDGIETVVLDGTGFSDPDGSIQGYEWTENAVVLGTTAALPSDFSVGSHVVTLTATDNEGATASDDVVITVSLPRGLPPGLVGNWSFDGDVLEQSDSRHDGTIVGGPASVTGVSGQAREFDGVDDAVSLPPMLNVTSTEFTVSAWINLNPAGVGKRTFFHASIIDNKDESIRFSVNKTIAERLTSGNDFGLNSVCRTGLGLDEWHMATLTLNQSTDTAKIYLDGVEVA